MPANQNRVKAMLVRLTPEEHAALMAEVANYPGSASDIAREGITYILRVRDRERNLYPNDK